MTGRSLLVLSFLVVTACSVVTDPPAGPTEDGGGPAASDGGRGSSGGGSSSGGSSSGGDASVPEPERCASPPCANGERCKDNVDCSSAVCKERVCFPASAGDRVKNAGETDVDCGGPPAGAPHCADGKMCAAHGDCASLSCGSGICQPPASGDGIKNGSETDIDCGGGAPTNAPRCATGKTCTATTDCDKVLCTGGSCQPPTNGDEIKNGSETDVDCGGGAPTNAPRCATGRTCTATTDCDKVLCTGGSCQPPASGDGIKNGSETDIDCGGGAPTNAPRCATGKTCTATADCDKVLCTGGSCQPATGTDGIKNGSESDVDCGGGAPTNAPRCVVDKVCTEHGDCGSSACAISGPKAGLCVPSKSCVKNNGGFTCGRNDTDFGDVTVAMESCCTTATIAGSAAKLNRFAITAGRMRAFIERLDGNVRGFVQAAATKPAGWSSTWDVLVPSNVAEAEMMLGQFWANAPNDPNTTGEAPHSKRSCGNDNYNGHTYYVQGEANQVYTQAQLDPKVLNCVGWHLVTAFCAWDGGRLATQAELRSAFTNGNTTTWPWGNAAYNNTVQDDRLNHVYNYGFPGGTPASNRITWWLSPPGRFWRGWNTNGIEIAGNVLEWTGDQQYNFAWNMSFENHTGNMNNGGDWRSPNDRTDVPNGYYALGARCAYP